MKTNAMLDETKAALRVLLLIGRQEARGRGSPVK